MRQLSQSKSGFERKTKREFVDEINLVLVLPWAKPVSLIAPHALAPGAKGDRPPFAVGRMLRVHLLQKWFSLSGSAIGEALFDTPMFRRFVGLDAGDDNLPGESTILQFRHLPKTQILSLQILATVNDETQVHALV